MRVLIACEESQRVCMAFREKGHEAYSCDIMECSGGHNEWHIKGDVLEVLNPKTEIKPLVTLYGNTSYKTNGIYFKTCDDIEHYVEKWDLIIAHPPCTHLCVSGARHFEKKRSDGRQREGIEFFCNFLNADCERIAIENPVGIISGDYIPQWFPDLAEKYSLPRKPAQVIHPWMFGDNYSKSTCLWLKGLPALVPEVTEEPEMEYLEWVDKKTGKTKRQAKWYCDALKLSPEERAKVRSKTFPGIAKAMAEQWG